MNSFLNLRILIENLGFHNSWAEDIFVLLFTIACLSLIFKIFKIFTNLIK